MQTETRIKTVPLYDDPAKGGKLIGYFAPETRTIYTKNLTPSQLDVDNASTGKGVIEWGKRRSFTRAMALDNVGTHRSKIHDRRAAAVQRQGL